MFVVQSVSFNFISRLCGASSKALQPANGPQRAPTHRSWSKLVQLGMHQHTMVPHNAWLGCGQAAHPMTLRAQQCAHSQQNAAVRRAPHPSHHHTQRGCWPAHQLLHCLPKASHPPSPIRSVLHACCTAPAACVETARHKCTPARMIAFRHIQQAHSRAAAVATHQMRQFAANAHTDGVQARSNTAGTFTSCSCCHHHACLSLLACSWCCSCSCCHLLCASSHPAAAAATAAAAVGAPYAAPVLRSLTARMRYSEHSTTLKPSKS